MYQKTLNKETSKKRGVKVMRMERKATIRITKRTPIQLWLDKNIGPVATPPSWQTYCFRDEERAYSEFGMTKTYLQCSFEEKLNGTIFYLN